MKIMKILKFIPFFVKKIVKKVSRLAILVMTSRVLNLDIWHTKQWSNLLSYAAKFNCITQ